MDQLAALREHLAEASRSRRGTRSAPPKWRPTLSDAPLPFPGTARGLSLGIFVPTRHACAPRVRSESLRQPGMGFLGPAGLRTRSGTCAPERFCFRAPRVTFSRKRPCDAFPSPGQILRHCCPVRAARGHSPWILWSCSRGKHLHEVTAHWLAAAVRGLDVEDRSHGTTGTFDDLRTGTTEYVSIRSKPPS